MGYFEFSSEQVKDDNFLSLFKLYKGLQRYKNEGKINFLKSIKIAIVSTFTTKGLSECLSVKCAFKGIYSDIYTCSYNQLYQEILDESSEIYKFSPDITFFLIDEISVLGEMYFNPYNETTEERKNFIQQKEKDIFSLIERFKELSNSKIVFNNFEVPYFSPLGILEERQEFGLKKTIEYINSNLSNRYREDNQTFIFDYNGFCSFFGKKNIKDYKMYYLGDIKISFDIIPLLSEEYLIYIKAATATNRKCLVLDLDNTLWGGVIGEDGLEGIKLGPNPEGRPFMELQKYILSLYKRGVILAINSRNNPNDALRVIREHPYMILKEEHFASVKINWKDKASNLIDISKEINIGLDSLVFFDDDKVNREMVIKVLPEVLVIDLPEDSSQYLNCMRKVNDFNTLQLTSEDIRKGKMYSEENSRKELYNSIVNLEDYIRSLEIVVTLENANKFNIPRISQLIQKTNQFNLTSKRYTQGDIEVLTTNKNYLVICANVSDRFGDSGITGVAIIKKEASIWTLDTFLLSCRVLGRKIEDTILKFIINEAKKDNIGKIIGEFQENSKNLPAKSFFKDKGFTLICIENYKEIWELNIS